MQCSTTDAAQTLASQLLRSSGQPRRRGSLPTPMETVDGTCAGTLTAPVLCTGSESLAAPWFVHAQCYLACCGQRQHASQEDRGGLCGHWLLHSNVSTLRVAQRWGWKVLGVVQVFASFHIFMPETAMLALRATSSAGGCVPGMRPSALPKGGWLC